MVKFSGLSVILTSYEMAKELLPELVKFKHTVKAFIVFTSEFNEAAAKELVNEHKEI